MKIVTNIVRNVNNLQKVNALKRKAAVRAINLGAIAIHRDVIKSFVAPKTGNEYTRGGKTHTASAPGEAPARDTGHLGQATSLNVASDKDAAPVAEVMSAAQYAAPLEFGTETMAARPFMRPAFNAHVDKIRAAVRKALK